MEYSYEKYDSAILNFKSAMQLNPGNADYSFGVASSYYEVKAYDSARKYIEATIALEPDQPDYHYRAGNIYFHSSNFQQAAQHYKITLNNLSEEYKINVINCYYNKAVSEYYLKNYETAIQDLTLLLKEDPEDDTAIHLRGVCFVKLKRMTEACQDLVKAKRMGNPGSQKYLNSYCN